MDSPYSRELNLAFGAIQKAAQLSQSIILSQDKGVVEKEDLSPVTVADFAIQALLIATFKHAFPDDSFVGEEDASSLRSNETLLERVWELLQRLSRDDGAGTLFSLPATRGQMCDLIDEAGTNSPGPGRTWVFDPIDGTKTYVRGELYAINICLLVGGKQRLGAVGCPNLAMEAQGPICNADIDPAGEGCILFAVEGHGAYVRTLRGSPAGTQPRRLPPVSGRADGVRFVTCVNLVDSALDGVHEAVADRLGAAFPGCDLLPWVVRWAALALGLADTTVWVYKRRDRLAKTWDHAGAMLLFQETGGKITDVHGRPIDVSAGRKLSANFGFVAAPEPLHGRVLEAVHEVLRQQGHGEMLT
ncbi:hypothetical protein CDD83_3107 [Cordyceps sp. RAO-2017]|nr:hypothetical protein CDD83_3107 [Cordyceps sp. RAO-2017]